MQVRGQARMFTFIVCKKKKRAIRKIYLLAFKKSFCMRERLFFSDRRKG